MRDGVRIALDVALPSPLPASGKVPTVLTMTRYWRALEGSEASSLQKLFTSYGYAVVSGDSRGTGASFGEWPHHRSRDETMDFGEVVDWIVSQPWSDGIVGAIGTSYSANTADWVAQNTRTAVKAIIPRFPDHDPYTDLYLPGGIWHVAFGKKWSDRVKAQDLNVKRVGADGIARGVKPVDADGDGRLLEAAVLERRNVLPFYDGFIEVTYRDDVSNLWGLSFSDWSIQNQRGAMERSKVAMYTWGGWFDAGTQSGVLRRFMTWSNTQRAIIGPWSHGARYHASPYLPTDTPTEPDADTQAMETVCYFDHYLKGIDNGIPNKQLVYYTVGEERWKTTDTWPPAGVGTERWYMTADNGLTRSAPSATEGADRYVVDFETSTGLTNRWQTQSGGGDVIYADRADADRRLLTYTSPPLTADLEVTGYPVVTLQMTSTATDGAFFVYLEDVDPSGRVTYLTEGHLRALHRKVSTDPPPYVEPVPYHSFRREDGAPLIAGQVAELSFGLLPTSVLIRQGHRIRIAIAGADKDTFAQIPSQGPPPTITVQRNEVHASFVDLPTMNRE